MQEAINEWLSSAQIKIGIPVHQASINTERDVSLSSFLPRLWIKKHGLNRKHVLALHFQHPPSVISDFDSI
jgi:hypothetical protein